MRWTKRLGRGITTRNFRPSIPCSRTCAMTLALRLPWSESEPACARCASAWTSATWNAGWRSSMRRLRWQQRIEAAQIRALPHLRHDAGDAGDGGNEARLLPNAGEERIDLGELGLDRPGIDCLLEQGHGRPSIAEHNLESGL